MGLRFDLYAAGVLAPGIDGLAALLDVCRGGALAPAQAPAAPLPAPQALPANERRRASQVVRLTLACAEQALRTSPFPADALRMVFASDEGTGETCQLMLEALATTRQVSPLLFHNSVHNAPSGYFSIAHRNRCSASSVSLGAESFASGLLCAASEAATTAQPVLLLAYDPAMAAPLDELLPVSEATACAWVIGAPGAADAPIASFDLSLHREPADTPAPAAWQHAAWAANSSAQGLRALGLLAGDPGRSHCDLPLGAQVLRIERLGGAAPC